METNGMRFLEYVRKGWWILAGIGAWIVVTAKLPEKVEANERALIEQRKDIQKNSETLDRVVPMMEKIREDVSFMRGQMEGKKGD